MENKNKKEENERVRARVLSLIDAEFESDASFERTLGLADKTVNNWRRGRSASFMRMLPTLTELFRVNVTELLDMPISDDASLLSEDEQHLVTLYRRSRTMPQAMRRALRETLEGTISLYLTAWTEAKRERGKKKK